MRKLFIDIETLPAHPDFHETLALLFNKRKRREKIDFEQFLLGTSFDGTYGRILCIGYAVDDEPVKVLYQEDDEKLLLAKFWQLAEDKDLFVGHNIFDFDLRFIYQRSVVNQVKPSKEIPIHRNTNYPVYDTMREWSQWANGNTGLEALALALGIPTPKDAMDGSQVYAYYKYGRIEEILDYCKKDVATTREVYKRMIFEKG